ncbi:hypothetical protein [Variovorax sp. dw_308]|nr:hypothetical protein [Variovorax sp. dw_308]
MNPSAANGDRRPGRADARLVATLLRVEVPGRDEVIAALERTI